MDTGEENPGLIEKFLTANEFWRGRPRARGKGIANRIHTIVFILIYTYFQV